MSGSIIRRRIVEVETNRVQDAQAQVRSYSTAFGMSELVLIS
jgi:hypothetical protein